MKRKNSGKADSSWPHVTAASLDVFERSLQKAGAWIDDLMSRLEWADRHQTYEALGVVLHVLRDRLPLEDCAGVGAQLPLLIRGLFYQNWDAAQSLQKYRHAREFLGRVREGLADHRLDSLPAPRLVQAVADLLVERLSPGVMNRIRLSLPPGLGALFEGSGITASRRPSFPKNLDEKGPLS